MQKEINNQAIQQRSLKILLLFLLLTVTTGIFLISILTTITSPRRIPSHDSTIHDRSLRGAIISADGYTLSYSQKTYQAVIRGESINPDKKTLFIRLFSIYSNIPEVEIEKKFKDSKGREKKGNIVLSKTLHTKSAMQLKSLAHKLRQLGVFRSIKNRNGIQVLYGLDIIENGEQRRFPLENIMTPILGYVGEKTEDGYVRPEGKKGLERVYEKHITSKKNGYFRGKRDVLGAVIHDKNSMKIHRVDGLNVHLNIPLSLQRRVELMLDSMKEKIEAEEIIVAVMESKTGKVLSLASSERFNPAHITQNDIAALNPKFSEYPYEAGSVLKPISLAIALNHNLVTPTTIFNTYNGKLRIGKRHWITDDDKFPSLSVTDIIVHSSNVGISQISWKLTGKEFREGLLGFGLSRPTGIDLSRDLPGQIKPLNLLNNELHRANSSYGYGMMVTFAQLFKAYSAFNNDGIAVTPRIVDYLEDANGNHYNPPKPISGNLEAINPKAANQIHDILLEVVKRGTGVKAQYPGLEVGGKTGTAHIAKNGHYVREYHSSFYGFVNDKEGHKYTVGVLVIRAKKYLHYFASLSAVPTFHNIVDILVDQEYLKPDTPQTDEEENLQAQLTTEPVKQIPATAVKQDRSIQQNLPKPAATPANKNNSVNELFNPKKKTSTPPKPYEPLQPPKQTKPAQQIQSPRQNKPMQPFYNQPANKKSSHEQFKNMF
ncbi:MAG: penicillin-binding protein 2 [Campylobacterales bacterium]|nr:penicillin-binding protein 2 [Campylobacterales bacterium]